MNPNNPFDNPDRPGTPGDGGLNNPWHDPNQQGGYHEPIKKEQPFTQAEPQFFQGPLQGGPMAQLPLQNATLVMVLGIVGIVFSCGIIGLILNIVTIVMSSQAMREANAHPAKYTPGSVKQARAGQILSIIGLCMFGLSMIFMVIYFVAVGFA